MSKENRTREMRYKRAALLSLGYDAILAELETIEEACSDIHWFTDQGDETLLNALEGDEEAAFEFRVAFSDLEAKADQLWEALTQRLGGWEEDGRTFDDCIVALIGNWYTTIGYDTVEEDYYGLTAYEQDLAYTEAGKRMMRRTKTDMLSTIGQCLGALVAFLDLRRKFVCAVLPL